MKQRPRIYYTEADKSLMWDRWQKGESLKPTPFSDTGHFVPDRWNTPIGETAIPPCINDSRTRGDLAGCRCRPFDSIDRDVT